MDEPFNANQFDLTGRVARLSILEKVHFLTLLVERMGDRKDFIDVTAFPRDCDLSMLGEGDVVKLRGHIGKRQDKKTGTWGLNLVATKMRLVKKGEAQGKPATEEPLHDSDIPL